MNLVDSQAFSTLVHERSAVLISNSVRIIGEGAENFVLTRPLLSLLQAESTQLEELLDAYGARSNKTWYPMRMHVAMLKNFSHAAYELLHLQHTFHAYDFEGQHADFEVALKGAVAYTTSFLFCSLKQLVGDTFNYSWPPPEEMLGYDFTENLPPGMLPKNRQFTDKDAAQNLVTHLATKYLNVSEDAKFLSDIAKSKGAEWRTLDSERISEVSIRNLEVSFHTLQSLYDTYVSYSDIEGTDKSLRQLRGHISIVLHLLKVTTIFIHFYERHVKLQGDELFCHKNCVLQGSWFNEVVAHFLCRYSYEFLDSARSLCQRMLKKYAIIDSVEVPAPPFFGFHVRPSTLISSIVRHYGNTVNMVINGQEYDAALPMNMFRANEWINQVKRTHVGEELTKMKEQLRKLQQEIDAGKNDRATAVKELLRELAGRDVVKLMVYPIEVQDIVQSAPAQSLLELTQTVIASLYAQRSINIPFEIKVKLTGDQRILRDIMILARHGYGEDEHGANIPLPDELAYLKHSRPVK